MHVFMNNDIALAGYMFAMHQVIWENAAKKLQMLKMNVKGLSKATS